MQEALTNTSEMIDPFSNKDHITTYYDQWAVVRPLFDLFFDKIRLNSRAVIGLKTT